MSESNTDRARRYLAVAGTALEAMQVIGAAVHDFVSRGTAYEISEVMAVLAGIQAVANRIKDGMDGTVSPEEIDKAVRELRDGLAANNAAIDADLDKRFPPST